MRATRRTFHLLSMVLTAFCSITTTRPLPRFPANLARSIASAAHSTKPSAKQLILSFRNFSSFAPMDTITFGQMLNLQNKLRFEKGSQTLAVKGRKSDGVAIARPMARL